MFAYRLKVVVRGKESFRAFQLTLLAFIALKSWIRELVTHGKNLVNVETPLNLISVRQKYI